MGSVSYTHLDVYKRQEYMSRPTVIYQQTTDGQLRADAEALQLRPRGHGLQVGPRLGLMFGIFRGV